jgi:hypothetical protein
MLPTVWADRIAQVGEGSDDPVIAPRAILPRYAHYQDLDLLVNHGTTGSLALCGAIKFLGHGLAVPGQDRVELDEARRFLQGLLPRLLTDLGPRLAFAVRQPHTACDLAAQDPILRHQVRMAQQQFLIDGSSDIRQQLFPVHRPP